jgi:hypothetical protein
MIKTIVIMVMGMMMMLTVMMMMVVVMMIRLCSFTVQPAITDPNPDQRVPTGSDRVDSLWMQMSQRLARGDVRLTLR